MKLCSKCNLEYDDKFAFCQKCGSKLEVKAEIQICPNCGKEADTDGGFCPYCRKPFYDTELTRTSTNNLSARGRNKNTNEVVDNQNHAKSNNKKIFLIILFVIVAIAFIWAINSFLQSRIIPEDSLY